MQDFTYQKVNSVQDLLAQLNNNGKKIKLLVGGTDLIPQLREGRNSADLVIDIKGIKELNEIRMDDSNLFIGSSVTCLQASNNEIIRTNYPGLVDAFSLIGGIQIQGRATIGGNVCNASPAADSIPSLIAHDTTCIVTSKDGIREIKLEDFFEGPGKNVMKPTEFLSGLKVKKPNKGFGGSYLRFTPRNEMDIAVVGVGSSVQIDLDTKTIQSSRIALGAVAPTPLFVVVGKSLEGIKADSDDLEKKIDEAAELASQSCNPISDMRGSADQRKHLVKVFVKRTLGIAIDRALERGNQ